MGDTEISWTHKPGTRGRTWNPVQGCRRVSPGCQNCYAERLAARFAENGWSKGLINLKTRKWNGEARLATHKLAEPLSWRQPSTVFVNSMSDLFYEEFTNEEIAAVFGVMAACPQHTFQVLTKRAKRMREWFEWMINALPLKDGYDPRARACGEFTARLLDKAGEFNDAVFEGGRFLRRHLPEVGHPWPLPNVWLGVSVENQEAADERIPWLLRAPAAVRFLSCEPLLGALDLRHITIPGGTAGVSSFDAIPPDPFGDSRIEWVIAGCESGPSARPCSVEWLRSLRDQCVTAGVPFFLKQASVGPGGLASDVPDPKPINIGTRSKWKHGSVIELPYLDGVQHAAFPEVP